VNQSLEYARKTADDMRISNSINIRPDWFNST